MKVRTLLRIAVALFGGSTLLGCQSYDDALEVICTAPSTCEECANAAPEDRMRVTMQHLESEVSNGDASTMLETLATVAPQAKVDILRAEAGKAGISECELADWMEEYLNPPAE